MSALHSILFTFVLVICFQTSCHTNSFKKPKLCRKCKGIRMVIHDKPGNVMQRKFACKYGQFPCQRLCLLMTQLSVLITGQRGNWFHVHQFLMFFFFHVCVLRAWLQPSEQCRNRRRRFCRLEEGLLHPNCRYQHYRDTQRHSSNFFFFLTTWSFCLKLLVHVIIYALDHPMCFQVCLALSLSSIWMQTKSPRWQPPVSRVWRTWPSKRNYFLIWISGRGGLGLVAPSSRFCVAPCLPQCDLWLPFMGLQTELKETNELQTRQKSHCIVIWWPVAAESQAWYSKIS